MLSKYFLISFAAFSIIACGSTAAFDVWLKDADGNPLDWSLEYERLNGCDTYDFRFTLSALSGEPVDEGDAIHIEGIGDMGPQTVVIIVSACFYDGGDFLGEVQQFDHDVVIDYDNFLRGNINALDFGGCYPCLYADNMKVIIGTSIGGIPPLYIWSSNNFLAVDYTGVIPTPTPVIPATGGAGAAVIIAIMSSLLAFRRIRSSRS